MVTLGSLGSGLLGRWGQVFDFDFRTMMLTVE